MSSASACERRLRKELDPFLPGAAPLPHNLTAALVDPTDPYRWRASFTGPADSPYACGTHELDLTFPADFPFAPPKVRFASDVFHPCVAPRRPAWARPERALRVSAGTVDRLIHKDHWSPALSVKALLLDLAEMLRDPAAALRATGHGGINARAAELLERGGAERFAAVAAAVANGAREEEVDLDDTTADQIPAP
mmetsp:Transcript_12240/g.40208  ORF Transcript_12240/g.40208 Transcript_12240/m.40208 type:complete len:195 (+) Transcript_12240:85-669(+)